MIKFVKIKLDSEKNIFKNLQYLEEIYHLYKKYNNFLNDDFAQCDNLLDFTIRQIQSVPFFWVILNKDKFAGFVFLENIVGNENHLHSAEITTCFKPEYWGDFTKKCAKKFIRYCFKKMKFKKLKAEVFRENLRVQALLRSAGMIKEAELKSETIKFGKPQDITIYSIVKR